jgi:hypothetical protein
MCFTVRKKHNKSTQTQRTHAELKRKAASDAKNYPSHSKIYKEWITKHYTEQRKGVAILHRIKALEALSRSDSKSNGTDPPPYTSTAITKEISNLWVLYREHLTAIDQILSGPPTGGYDGDYQLFKFQQTTYNHNGQTLAWEEHQKRCAVRGGCCGRACECCAQSLRKHYIPLPGGVRKNHVVYGHCTAECWCCNLFYRCYKPDGRLPKVDLALIKTLAG